MGTEFNNIQVRQGSSQHVNVIKQNTAGIRSTLIQKYNEYKETGDPRISHIEAAVTTLTDSSSPIFNHFPVFFSVFFKKVLLSRATLSKGGSRIPATYSFYINIIRNTREYL